MMAHQNRVFMKGSTAPIELRFRHRGEPVSMAGTTEAQFRFVNKQNSESFFSANLPFTIIGDSSETLTVTVPSTMFNTASSSFFDTPSEAYEGNYWHTYNLRIIKDGEPMVVLYGDARIVEAL